MKKTVAVFEYVTGVLTGMQVITESHMENWQEAVRISEYVEIDFPDANRGDLVRRQIDVIDKEIDKARAKHADNIGRLEQRKAELLALTCDN